MTKIVGSAYKELQSLIESYAKADLPLLLLGDTGSGKELFAQRFMELSKGKKIREGAQRTVSCATFSDNLLRDEIFGHEKGAFTGADAARYGLLRTCNNGILFLDELDKASMEFQNAVLRVAEGYSFRQTGSDKEITDNDTLIIAAASRLSLINDQLINRFHILAVPPLQKFDIPELAEHFLGRPLRDEVSDLLVNHEYPGNVRELKKFCERLNIKRGTNLFSNSIKIRPHEDHPFDYERFKDEFLLWHDYLAPIIDKFKLGIRYTYQQGSMEYESHPDQTIHVMKVLRHGSEDIGDVEIFDRLLRSHIKNLELSNLLGEIYKQCKAPIPQNIRGRIDAELPKLTLTMKAHGYKGDHAYELPAKEEDHELTGQLQELLRLPIREARKQFSKLYLDTVLRKSDSDLKRAAEMTRLTKKGLESNMKRYDIKIHLTK